MFVWEERIMYEMSLRYLVAKCLPFKIFRKELYLEVNTIVVSPEMSIYRK